MLSVDKITAVGFVSGVNGVEGEGGELCLGQGVPCRSQLARLVLRLIVEASGIPLRTGLMECGVGPLKSLFEGTDALQEVGLPRCGRRELPLCLGELAGLRARRGPPCHARGGLVGRLVALE